MTQERSTEAEAEARDAFTSFAGLVRARVETELVRIFDEETIAAKADGSSSAVVIDALRQITMRGGKRLRPALLGVGFIAAGGEADDRTIAVAGAALELLQSYLLIHDDWMDESVLRRGGPTAHVLLRGAFGDASSASGAVLAGDYGSALSQRVILEVPGAPDRVLAASRLLARVHGEVVRGQVLDMFDRLGDVRAVEHRYALKTASYTVSGPLAMGALLAGGNALAVSLEPIGRAVGVAFQLQDDLLGLFGAEASMGKSVGTDLRDGKGTWITTELFRTAEGRALVAQVFGRKDAGTHAVENALSVLRDHPAVSACRARIAMLCDEARRALDSTTITPSADRLLRGAIDALTERDA